MHHAEGGGLRAKGTGSAYDLTTAVVPVKMKCVDNYRNFYAWQYYCSVEMKTPKLHADWLVLTFWSQC